MAAERTRTVIGRIERVEGPRAADVLADELRRTIYAGTVAPGDHLPAERALVEQTGLGRPSVREALRLLEAQDLIERRLGRTGGWVVRRPGPDSVARSIEVLIRGQRLRLEAVVEAREAIEPACAALAAVHRTDADLAELERCTAELRAEAGDVPAYLRGNLRWHLAVVAASHNELLLATMTAMAAVIHAGSDIEGFNSEGVRAAALDAHDRVLAAIRAGDAEAASRRMHRHLHAFRAELSGPQADAPVRPRRGRGGS